MFVTPPKKLFPLDPIPPETIKAPLVEDVDEKN